MQEILSKLVVNIVNPILRIGMIAALVVFLYGMFGFIRNGDQPDKRTEGQQHMLWGVIGLAIIVSAFAIIRIIVGSIGAETPQIVNF
jgi:uncharacterized membrane protein